MKETNEGWEDIIFKDDILIAFPEEFQKPFEKASFNKVLEIDENYNMTACITRSNLCPRKRYVEYKTNEELELYELLSISFVAFLIIFIGVFIGYLMKKKEFYEDKIKQKGFKNLEVDEQFDIENTLETI